jgi:hypothetical protein
MIGEFSEVPCGAWVVSHLLLLLLLAANGLLFIQHGLHPRHQVPGAYIRPLFGLT